MGLQFCWNPAVQTNNPVSVTPLSMLEKHGLGFDPQSKSDLENRSNGEINPDRPRFGLLIAPKLSIYHEF